MLSVMGFAEETYNSLYAIHDYYPFALEDEGRLAPTAVELVDRLAISVAVRRFPSMGSADSRSLQSIVMLFAIDSFVRMRHFVRRTMLFLFGVSVGMYGENSCNVFMLLFMVLWFPVSVSLCMRVVLMLWHAFLFLGLRSFPRFFLFIWWSTAYFNCKYILLLFLTRITSNKEVESTKQNERKTIGRKKHSQA
jgi:hypothetical protein